MANTVGGFNPIINRYKTQKTDELAQKLNSYSQSVAPEANFDIGNMLNGTISSEVGAALDGSMNSLFNIGPGYNFDLKSIFNKLKSQAIAMIKTYIQNSLITSILKLLVFDDTAETAARVADGKAKNVKNTVQASALQVKLVTSGVQALMELAQTGEITQATLSQQLADIVNTGVEAAMVGKELTERQAQITEENEKLKEDIDKLQKKLEEKYADKEKKFASCEFNKMKTEDLAEMKPEEMFGEDMPGDIEEDADYIELQEKIGQLKLNAQNMVTIAKSLENNSKLVQSAKEAAESKGEEIKTNGQNHVIETSEKFKNLSGDYTNQMTNKSITNSKDSIGTAVDANANGVIDNTNAGTQLATGTPMLSNIFTASTGQKLVRNAALNFGAGVINNTFGGVMFGNAFKDLVQGKTLTQIILDKLKEVAIQNANKMIASIAPSIANPFEGTIFQDTFASMTNVSGWMQEASTQAIENPFKKFEKDIEK